MRTHINGVPGKRHGNLKQTHSIIFDLSPGLTAGLMLWQQGKRVITKTTSSLCVCFAREMAV